MGTGQESSHHTGRGHRRFRLASLVSAALFIPFLLVVAPGTAQAVPSTCGGFVATIVGTESSDFIIATQGNDVISLGAGNDVVFAVTGNDVICGGLGDDYLDGGVGSDAIDGGAGFDTCTNGEAARNCED